MENLTRFLAVILLGSASFSLAAAEPRTSDSPLDAVTSPRPMREEDILRVAESWKNRVFLVVADGGPCRVPLEQVLENPKVLFRKRRVGCAVYVGEGRLLMTTASVVKDNPEVEVFSDAGNHVLARIVGVDPYLDIALLETIEDLPGSESLPTLTPATEPIPGANCMVLGNAFGRSLSATLGTIQNIVEIVPSGLPIRVHRVNAQIYPGDSGGPVLDPEGGFLGIVTAASVPGDAAILEGIVGESEIRDLRRKAASNAGFAVPARDCEWAWTELRRHGRVRRAYLGVEMSVVDEGEEGARILNVVPGSPAHRVGIRRGDLITEFGEMFINSPRQFCALVAATRPHVELDIRLLRGTQPHTMSVTLGEARNLPRVRRLKGEAPLLPTAEATAPDR